MLDFSLLGSPLQCLLSGSQQQERQDETWEGLLPHTSERWHDNKWPKRHGKAQTQPDKTSREQSLRMSHQYQRLVSSHDSSLSSQQQHELHTLCEEGLLDRALDALFRMDTAPPISVYMSLLKQCNKSKSLTHAKRVHAHVSVHCLEPTGLLADYLVVTLASCGAIEDALQIFHGLANRTVFSWTAIISAYTDCGWAQEALQMFQCMEEDGIEPNHYTFVSLFKACGIIPDVKEGKKLHADANRKGFASDVFVSNTLVSMYGKCGAIVEAENVFRGMSRHDVVSWNSMLCAYVEQGHAEKALQLYRQMQEEGVIPNQRTFSIALQACDILAEKEEGSLARGPSKLVTWELGQAIHADARRKGFASEVVVGTALVSMYSKCGNIVDAENVFRALCEHDVISWTALQTAYVEHDQEVKALQLYVQMQGEGVSPNQQTLMIALQACGVLAEKEGGHSKKVMPLVIGKALHECALTKGYATDLVVGNALVTLFGKCGAIAEAETVFCRLSQCDIVSWNAMLSAYIEQGHGEKALQLYKQMKEEGVSPDELTFVIALQACGTLAEKEKATDLEGQSAKVMSLEIGLALHNEACQGGFALDLLVGNTLVSMYGKCGTIVEAENVFGGLSQCDVVSWNAMLSAYVEQGQGERALQLYRQMQNKGVSLTDVTLICILQTCSEMGSLETCKHLHYTIVSSGFDLNLSLAATLIHAYGSCGSMADAQAVSDGLPQPVIVSRNACFAGYAGEGNCVATAQMFNEMQLAGIRPDEVTFASVLSGCSHAGLVIQGLQYFESMRRDYGITPNLIHYGSMVDLLGRAGDFKRINNILGRMPMQADLTLWLNLLVACRVHGNAELGKEVFDHAVNLQPKEAGAYVLMSNICADAGLPAETRHVEARIEND